MRVVRVSMYVWTGRCCQRLYSILRAKGKILKLLEAYICTSVCMYVCVYVSLDVETDRHKITWAGTTNAVCNRRVRVHVRECIRPVPFLCLYVRSKRLPTGLCILVFMCAIVHSVRQYLLCRQSVREYWSSCV